MRSAATISLAVLMAGAVPAAAQDAAARKAEVEAAFARVPFEKTTTGAPYSAETVVEGVQTLADGNRIVRKTTGRVYRDGEGRTRREEDTQVPVSKNAATGAVTVVGRTTISVIDPVAGFSYALDPERKIAWQTPIGAGAAIMDKLEALKVEVMMRAEMEKRAARAAGATDKPSTDARAADERKMVEVERGAMAGAGRGGALGPAGMDVRMRGNPEAYKMAAAAGPLEHKTLEGVAVEGRKTTTVIPAGQVGNEQPLTIVSEEWRSTELNVLVMTHHSDPRTGDSSYRLTSIIRAEPDRSLFMVPPDYEIRDTGVRKLEAQRKRED